MNGTQSVLAGRVALVAGATRGACRAIAVELARAGAYVFATGRSSRATGRSEIDRPETIEETGELITKAGGAGEAIVVDRIVKSLTAELMDRPVSALGVTPGWLRSENMLDHFGVTEETWRDALVPVPGFAISESPTYVARGIAALAGDDDAHRFAGLVLTARQLADVYDLTDIDGSRPDCWGYITAYGIGEQSGKDVESFR